MGVERLITAVHHRYRWCAHSRVSVDFLKADQHGQCRLQPRVLPASRRFGERTALDEAGVDDLRYRSSRRSSAIMSLREIAMLVPMPEPQLAHTQP